MLAFKIFIVSTLTTNITRDGPSILEGQLDKLSFMVRERSLDYTVIFPYIGKSFDPNILTLSARKRSDGKEHCSFSCRLSLAVVEIIVAVDSFGDTVVKIWRALKFTF